MFMLNKRILIATGEYYHVYNRSIAKEPLFSSYFYLKLALDTIAYYRFPQIIRFSDFRHYTAQQKNNYLLQINKNQPFVEIYTFTFMPNHYHLQLKQLQNNGIFKFITNFQNSFAKYYNIKENRTGGLFQTSFKVKRILSIEEFIHVSRYIHLNPVTSSLIKSEKLLTYPYTSYPLYIYQQQKEFLSCEIILNHFKTLDNYISFINSQIDYQIKLDQIKHLLFD